MVTFSIFRDCCGYVADIHIAVVQIASSHYIIFILKLMLWDQADDATWDGTAPLAGSLSVMCGCGVAEVARSVPRV